MAKDIGAANFSARKPTNAIALLVQCAGIENVPQPRRFGIMHKHVKKWLFIALGLASVAAGIIGIFLPVVPTVPFLLLALWAFARSSERLHAWLLHHPRFGAPLRQWQETRAIPARTKLLSVGSMGVAAVWLVGFAEVPGWALAAALAFMAYGAWFVLSRPTLS